MIEVYNSVKTRQHTVGVFGVKHDSLLLYERLILFIIAFAV